MKRVLSAIGDPNFHVSPARVLLTVLGVIFAVEYLVMTAIFAVFPRGADFRFETLLDAVLMTLISAPLIWWTIVRPLRRATAAEHAKAELIVGAAMEGIVTVDESGAVRSFNKAAEEIFGYPADEILGRNLEVLLPEHLIGDRGTGLRRVVEGGESSVVGRTAEVAGRRRDGRQVPLSLSMTAVRLNDRWLFTGLVRDLTAAKLAAEERAARDAQQAVMVKQAQRALVCDDLAQLLRETAACAAATLGVEHCLILELTADGRTLLLRAAFGWPEGLPDLSTLDVQADGFEATLRATGPVVVESFRSDGRYAGPDLLREPGVAAGMTVAIHQEGRPWGVLGVYSDRPRTFTIDEAHFLQDIAFVITLAMQRKQAELRQRERDVLMAEHMARVAQMATGVAHELRNPLTAIKMLIQAAREDGPAGLVKGEDLEYIEQEIRRMERHLQHHLEFARPRKPERRPTDLAELAVRTLALVEVRAGRQGVAAGLTPPAAPVIVDADWEQLQQLLLNLVLNALDAMPRGGLLTIEIPPPVGPLAEVRVADTGPGIAPQALARLFQPFVSGKATGTGLGLVISRRIAEDHGGTLTARNLTEGGACFVLRLPVLAGSPG